jgi:diguanylate cyclase (GGDEF)-like protein
MAIYPRKIWSSPTLPTLPSVAIRLLDASRDPDFNVKTLCDLIKSDPAISVKLLKSTNSTYFGFANKVTSIERAVPLLGTNVVVTLALSFSLVDSARGSGPSARHFSHFWLQSLVQAAAAEAIAKQKAPGSASEYFLAGLLVDLGRLAMLKTITAQYVPVLDAAEQKHQPLFDATLETLGLDERMISRELMNHWKLPDSLRAAVNVARGTTAEIDALANTPEAGLAQAVAIAAAIGDYFCSSAKGVALNRLTELGKRYLGLEGTALEDFIEQMRQRTVETAQLFAVDADELGDPADIMAMANEQLAQLAVNASVATRQVEKEKEEITAEKQRLVAANEQLQKQAMHDGLTKIYNRKFFDEAISKECQRCLRVAAPMGLLFADVDRFKSINDTWGHQVGDVVLVRVAAAIGQVLRGADTLARYGGEEFVILASQPTEKGLERLAERIREQIETTVIEHEGRRIPVTASIGAAMIIPGRQDEGVVARLIEQADQAMYEAKEGGRNQVRLRVLLDQAERELAQAVTQRRFSRWLVAGKHLDQSVVMRALVSIASTSLKVGELAIQLGLMDATQVAAVLVDQDSSGQRFGQIAVRMGLITPPQLVELLALQQESPRSLALALAQAGATDPRKLAELMAQHRAAGARMPTPVAVG